MSTLREKMSMDLQLKNYSPKTQQAYIRYVKRYSEYFHQSPDQLGTDEIRAYLHYLIINKKVSSSYINSVYSALKFFYQITLKREWDIKEIPRMKKHKKLPVVLSTSEVKQIFEATTNLKYRAIFMTIYAAGLRISEASNLKISDIDSKNMQIRVIQGKGKKDRYTLLSIENLKVLREYFKYYRPILWLFPGNPLNKSISTRSIQKMFKKSKEKAGIKKEATVHTLRHCFATHLIEAGTGIYHIQKLMGHTNPKTTSIYIHLTRQDVLNVKSPLDLLMGV
ncbi:site-specific integrase [Lutibacter sp. B2]|nr:site-specific integrase [Lutibacter sp. B2]